MSENAPAAPTAEEHIRVMRHELRTPVNHIVGYSEMLADELGSLPAAAELLAAVGAAGRRLLAAINQAIEAAAGAPAELDRLLRAGEIAATLGRVQALADSLAALLRAEGRTEWLPDLQRIDSAAASLALLIAGGLQQSAIEAGAQAALHARPAAEPGAAHGTLLVVEDNELNRDMLARRLQRLGYEVVAAEDGRRALALLAEREVDLILLDIMMPEMNGYQVLEILKADEALRHTPVIVLSALDELASVVHCIELGADDYLPKPFDPVLLGARIGASLEKKRLRDQEQTYLGQIQIAKKRADDLLHVVIPIGVALSSEKGYERLLEKIVVEAMGLCNADGGSLYMRTDDDRLEFVVLRNRSMDIAVGGTSGSAATFPPLRLHDPETGEPNHRFMVTHTALARESVSIPDAYDAAGFDFSGTRAFDERTGYRTASLLAVPLMDTIGRVIGVLQLLNAQDQAGAVIPFDDGMREMIESLSALAAAALTVYEREQRLRDQIARLEIVIDEEKRRREVSQITESDYFQRLRDRARELRGAMPPAPGATSASAEPAATAEPATPGAPGEHIRERLRDLREHVHAALPQDEGEPDALLAPLRERESRRHRHVYTVGGQEVHVQEEGRTSGDVAILIHGWSSSWYAMSPLLPMLGRTYRCIAVDLPGYGDSPRLAQRTTIEAYADLLAGLIEQVSDRPVVLVGHSMGGMISLTVALRHPHLVERMVLLCPTISGQLSLFINLFVFPVTLLERFSVASWLVAALEPQLLSVTDRLMRPASFAERTGISEADYHQLRADARRPGQGRVRSECFWAMRRGDLRGRLRGLPMPALVLWGMEDNTVPLRDASVVSDEWPEAELRVVPKAGHWPQFETPDLTQRAIRAFLSTPIKLLKAQF